MDAHIIETKLPRQFTPQEVKDIKDCAKYIQECTIEKDGLSRCPTANGFNQLRELAKEAYPERIISAVDGMRKWVIKYDKATKEKTVVGFKIS
jgi:hypothetical protein